MDFSAAMSKLKTLEVEGIADVLSAIEGEVKSLQSKNYEVIGEKRTATTKAQALETALGAIAKAVGIEGDTESILGSTEAKVREITTKAQTLEATKADLETRASAAETKLKGFERKDKVREIATAAGANAAVLEKLLGDRLDDLKVEGEGETRVVKLGDKVLKEAIAQDEALKAFETSLFPTAADTKTTETKTTPKLPSGSPGGKDSGTADPLASYLGTAYAVPGKKESKDG